MKVAKIGPKCLFFKRKQSCRHNFFEPRNSCLQIFSTITVQYLIHNSDSPRYRSIFGFEIPVRIASYFYRHIFYLGDCYVLPPSSKPDFVKQRMQGERWLLKEFLKKTWVCKSFSEGVTKFWGQGSAASFFDVGLYLFPCPGSESVRCAGDAKPLRRYPVRSVRGAHRRAGSHAVRQYRHRRCNFWGRFHRYQNLQKHFFL